MTDSTAPRAATTPPDYFCQQARQLLAEATKHDISLRLMGSVAIGLRCEAFLRQFVAETRVYKDIDFAGLRGESAVIRRLFEAHGWLHHPNVELVSDGGRMAFDRRDTRLHADVFLDEIRMCHTIDLRTRLVLDQTTLTPADLLLSKLQRIDLREVDIEDALCILATFGVGPGDPDTINAQYICGLLGANWGFWRTTIDNLAKLRGFLLQLTESGPSSTAQVQSRITQLDQELTAVPKTIRWKARAVLGRAFRYYNRVDDAGGF